MLAGEPADRRSTLRIFQIIQGVHPVQFQPLRGGVGRAPPLPLQRAEALLMRVAEMDRMRLLVRIQVPVADFDMADHDGMVQTPVDRALDGRALCGLGDRRAIHQDGLSFFLELLRRCAPPLEILH